MPTIGTLGRALPPILGIIGLVGLSLVNDRFIESTARPVGASDPLLRLAVLAAGMALIGSGILAITAGTLRQPGMIAILAGLAWLGPELARFATDIPLLRSAAVAAGLLVLPLLMHLLLAARVPWRPRRAVGRAVVVLDVAIVTVAGAVFVTYAPFYDPFCPGACNYLTPLVDVPLSTRSMITDAGRLITVTAGAVLLLVAVSSLAERPPRRPAREVLFAGAVAAGLGAIFYALASLGRAVPRAAPELDDGAWLSLALLCLGLGAAAAGLSLVVGAYLRARYRISSLAESLATATRLGSLESELARVLDDAKLRVGYPVDREASLVDADGEPLDMPPVPGRDTTKLSRADVTLAIVAHRDDIDRRVLIDAFRPSLLVSLDNERLRALRLARLRDLRGSRARIVELADAERRRVERDLHDGAQQGLLAVAFDLRLAAIAAELEGRAEAAILHHHAEALALTIVEDLRHLCRGIHPQVLSQAGLGPALASLADESEIPLEISMAVTDRVPLAVETTAYELVRDALAQAVAHGAAALYVSVRHSADELVVEARDDTADALRLRQRAADRVGAVGGVLVAGVTDGRGFVRAELRCG